MIGVVDVALLVDDGEDDVPPLICLRLEGEDAGGGRSWADVLAFDWESEWQDAMFFRPAEGWAPPLRLLTEQLVGGSDVTGWTVDNAALLREILELPVPPAWGELLQLPPVPVDAPVEETALRERPGGSAEAAE